MRNTEDCTFLSAATAPGLAVCTETESEVQVHCINTVCTLPHEYLKMLKISDFNIT